MWLVTKLKQNNAGNVKRRSRSFGMLRRVLYYVRSAFRRDLLFRIQDRTANGETRFSDTSTYTIPNYTASYPWKPKSRYSLPWELRALATWLLTSTALTHLGLWSRTMPVFRRKVLPPPSRFKWAGASNQLTKKLTKGGQRPLLPFLSTKLRQLYLGSTPSQEHVTLRTCRLHGVTIQKTSKNAPVTPPPLHAQQDDCFLTCSLYMVQTSSCVSQIQFHSCSQIVFWFGQPNRCFRSLR
jgi:hypothetical protein